MERAYHHTSHLGMMNCDRYLTANQNPRAPITISELERWANYFAGKYQTALFHHCDVAIRTLEDNLKALADYANDLVEVQS